jgi:hypothetical protein
MGLGITSKFESSGIKEVSTESSGGKKIMSLFGENCIPLINK